jgi:outer membrane receptor protein involved in Fe transport
VTGGLKGSITPNIRFRADVTYSTTKDTHFFVNDTTSGVPLQNKFTAVYDDLDQVTYHGEVAVDVSSSVRFSLNGSYYNYKVFEQEKPWHKPQYEAGLDLTAKITGKLTLGTGINVIGTRWVKTYPVSPEPLKIKPVADLNLGLNYQYSRAFSLFAELYNMADRSYILWNQYPSQRFHFMFGLTYKL